MKMGIWWQQGKPQPPGCSSASLGQAPSFLVASQAEDLAHARIESARACTDAGVRAGAKAGLITALLSTPAVLIGARKIPWAQRNLNYTAQALLISSATIAAYFIVCDQTILECARSTSFARIEAERAARDRQTN